MKERFHPSAHGARGFERLAPVRRIAVLRALYLGDLLCATPALRALDWRFPQAEIALIGLPWARELTERLPYIDRLLTFPGYPGIPETDYLPERTNAFLAAARARGYDLAIQLHGDGSSSNGFVAELGARVSAGYCRGADDRLSLTLPYRDDENEVLRWLRLVESLPGPEMPAPAHSPLLDFPVTPDEHARAAELLPTPALALRVGLHAGSKLADRRWPPERFAALADALIERCRANIVLTGIEAERPLTAAIRRHMRYPALDLTGRTDLGTFAAIVRRLDLVVANDTGASHVAAAMGTRSVVLFGPTRPRQWAPLDRERHCAIDAHALLDAAGDPATALQRLAVEPVLAACLHMLAPRTGHRHTDIDPAAYRTERQSNRYREPSWDE
jgi:ADP-heptose:LPS heptosyltransferase